MKPLNESQVNKLSPDDQADYLRACEFSHGESNTDDPHPSQVVNHWGKWVNSNEPVTGVQGFNSLPSWVFDEAMTGIDLGCLECENRDKEDGCDFCESRGDTLIGAWIQDPQDKKYGPDPAGEYAGILRETVLQIVFSKTTRRGALCSPCYPGQVDLDTPGEFLAYCLPNEE